MDDASNVDLTSSGTDDASPLIPGAGQGRCYKQHLFVSAARNRPLSARCLSPVPINSPSTG